MSVDQCTPNYEIDKKRLEELMEQDFWELYHYIESFIGTRDIPYNKQYYEKRINDFNTGCYDSVKKNDRESYDLLYDRLTAFLMMKIEDED